ncbi:hypothetical protein NL676_014531 [Syzygium grande]|nr:hypothetical protein NL676_014531 [Syzygium grande]
MYLLALHVRFVSEDLKETFKASSCRKAICHPPNESDADKPRLIFSSESSSKILQFGKTLSECGFIGLFTCSTKEESLEAWSARVVASRSESSKWAERSSLSPWVRLERLVVQVHPDLFTCSVGFHFIMLRANGGCWPRLGAYPSDEKQCHPCEKCARSVPFTGKPQRENRSTLGLIVKKA